MQTIKYKAGKTHPDIHINICYNRLYVEKLIVAQVVNKLPVFCKNRKRSPLAAV